MSVNGINLSDMGERLRSERKRLGWTQQQAADRLGVGRNALATYEIGRTPPDIVLLDLARQNGMDAWYILTGTRAPEAAVDLLNRELLTTTVQAVRQFATEHELDIGPDRELALVLILYRQFARLGKLDFTIFNETMKVA
jgi:transcriptional regulator with XRE-family HTH domain